MTLIEHPETYTPIETADMKGRIVAREIKIGPLTICIYPQDEPTEQPAPCIHQWKDGTCLFNGNAVCEKTGREMSDCEAEHTADEERGPSNEQKEHFKRGGR